MGTGSEVEAGGLGWDVPGWGVVCVVVVVCSCC